MNYYDLLQINQNASDEVIIAAHKALAKKYHPDNFIDNYQAENMIKDINIARDILLDPVKRYDYNKQLEKEVQMRKSPKEPDYHNKKVYESENNSTTKNYKARDSYTNVNESKESSSGTNKHNTLFAIVKVIIFFIVFLYLCLLTNQILHNIFSENKQNEFNDVAISEDDLIRNSVVTDNKRNIVEMTSDNTTQNTATSILDSAKRISAGTFAFIDMTAYM